MILRETPFTQLLKDTVGKRFESDPNSVWLMYDQIAVASLIDSSIVTTKKLYVDVNIDHGISYGVSVGGDELWPGAEGAQSMSVQYDLNWVRFIKMFSERIQRPIPE
jgi:inosine-uridine nucleoside N-ribohydrolase